MEQQQPAPPAPQAADIQQVTALHTATSHKKRTVLGIWLIIGPTVLLVGTILLFAVANFIGELVDPGPDATTAMFGAPTLGGMIVNLVLFLVGAVGVLAWLPCLIIGIVLLATKKKEV